jgi:hypothetical protein
MAGNGGMKQANKLKVAEKRREKLAQALRENLKKRKELARAVAKLSASEEPET